MTAAHGVLAKRLITAICEGDLDVMRECLAQDVRWYQPKSVEDVGLPQTQEGAEAVLGMVTDAHENHFWPLTAVFRQVLVDGDRVAVLTTLSCSLRRGGDYENTYAFVMRVEDGRVAEVWELLDTAHLARTLARATVPGA